MASRRAARLLPVLAVFALGAALAGCASLPTSGPVQQGQEVSAGVDEPFIRVLPQAPAPGLPPVAVVRGFLAASASFESDHEVAREFLTPAASASWDSGAGVVVYEDERGFSLRSTAPRRVQLRAQTYATINADGSLTPRRNVTATTTFQMARVAGEWRIASLPDGLILTRLDVARSYRPLDLFFLAGQSALLVPDPVYVPIVRPGSATSLMRALLDGPTPWLAPAVRTAFPAGTALVVDSVPVENGIAQVDLTNEVLKASQSELSALTAQTVWTLSQLTEVTGVRITAEGSDLSLPVGSGVQTTSDWSGFDPNAASSTVSGLAVSGGRVVELNGDSFVPVLGPFGDGTYALRTPASSWVGDRIAAVTADGRQLLVQDQAAPQRVGRVFTGADLAPPSFDGGGLLWFVDRTERGSVVRVADAQGATQRVDAPGLARRRVSELVISRDGARAAVIVQRADGSGQLLLARLERSGSRLLLNGLRPLERTLTDVRSAAWSSADRIVVLARQHGAAVQPWTVGIDGLVAPTGGSLRGLKTVAAAPDRPLLVGTTDGRLWEDTGLSWRELSRGFDPSYSG
ncbi:MAG: LpqB family beta-propeller domain-containing protein [Actinomycetes bacterium]